MTFSGQDKYKKKQRESDNVVRSLLDRDHGNKDKYTGDKKCEKKLFANKIQIWNVENCQIFICLTHQEELAKRFGKRTETKHCCDAIGLGNR